MNLNRLNRKVHYWAAIVVAAPFLVVLVTGLFLQLKKDVAWVQPPTARGKGGEPTITFGEVLQAVSSDPAAAQAGIQGWEDIDRLDVRPDRGVVKVQAKNHWEVQLDLTTGEVLQVAYRRSDVIEAIHDGSWFHESAKLWLFLPCAVVVLGMWVTGMYLFWLPIVVRRRRRREAAKEAGAG